MKVTGIILALVGLIAGAIVLFGLTNPNQEAPLTNDAQVQRPSVVIPLAVCGASILIGGAMYMYGGRSYRVNNNPRVTS